MYLSMDEERFQEDTGGLGTQGSGLWGVSGEGKRTKLELRDLMNLVPRKRGTEPLGPGWTSRHPHNQVVLSSLVSGLREEGRP